MTDKNWSQIGDEIEDMVRKALESRDFGKLSQDLSRTVGEAMENVGKSVQDAVNKADDKTREATERYSDRADRTTDAHSRTEKSTDRPVYSGTVEGKGTSSSGQTSYEYSSSTMRSTRFQPGYEQAREKKGKNFLRERFKNPGGLTGTGMALAICGYTFLSILVIALGITLPIVLPRNLQAAMITTGVLAPFVAGSAFMAYKGTSLLGQSRRFRRYVEEHYKEPELSVNSIAEQFHVQAAYLSKLFRRKENGKLSQYIHEVRLDYAKEMLLENARMEDVAIGCGFGSQRTFLRIFKQYEGITPTQWKELEEKKGKEEMEL